MKKLLTLVLAIAMVFAIAAPALALGGDPIVATDNSKNVDLTIALYSGKLTSKTDLEKVTPWTQNVLKDQEVTIVVGVTAKAKLPVVSGTTLSIEAAGLKKSETVIDVSTATAAAKVDYADTTKKTTAVLASEADLSKEAQFTKDSTVYYFIQGVANGAISATAKLGFTGALEANTKTGKDGITVEMTKPTDGYNYVVTITDKATKALAITVAKNGAVTNVTWDDEKLDKSNVINANGVNELQWATKTGVALTKGDQAAIDAIFTQFNLNWNNLNGYALPASYIYAQVAGVTKSVSLANALHTASLTVSDPTTVPATGDMSVVGIALAIVALAAAGFVVAKKVRA